MKDQAETPSEQAPVLKPARRFSWPSILTIEWWMPRTLMARASLTIVVPLILVQVTSTYIFYDNHWSTMSRRMQSSLAGDIASIAGFLNDFPGEESRSWLVQNARQTMQLEIHVEDGAKLSGGNVVGSDEDLDNTTFQRELQEVLWTALRRPFTIDLDRRLGDQMAIDVQLSDAVLHVIVPRGRLFSSTTYVFVIWMVGSSLLLFGVAALYLRNQVQTVRRLARAADDFGKGREVPDFTPEGALEVRQAARAFNIMRNRIKRQIVQRTEMLAGVSHDLRTPLTRMKLQLAMMERATAEDIAALKDDANAMERMLDAYLAFARGEGAEEAISTDLADLLEAVVGRFRREGHGIDLTMSDLPARMPLKPIALERCLGNLIANATRYGKAVAVTAARTGRFIDFHVDDNGPGIPAAQREEVFRAFHRLEPSRNPMTGGVGLGLTIARDIVRSMGGEIELTDSPMGGLRASLRIPL